ncbi:MAG: FadR family transcriptional regulator [Acidobacteria bacterium]|nr:FadR family transcriptional regulator [Acidobacteriota bacterium]
MGEERIERPPRLPELVAQRMQELMFSGQWEPDSRVPTEAELCGQFGVSRTVVREGLRLLAARGLVTEAPGKGLIVSQNVAQPLRNFIDLFLAKQSSVGHRHLFEVRSLLEVEIAGLAAERATPVELEKVERILLELRDLNRKSEPWSDEDTRRFERLDFRFHLTIAECTKNELFVLLLGALYDAFLISWAGMCRRPEVRRRAVETHEKIFVAVRAGSARAARRATRENLNAFLMDAGPTDLPAQTTVTI